MTDRPIINLGDRVRERYTGIEGIVIAITHWITSCDHIGVKREGLDKDGKPYELLWFDEPNVEVIRAGVVTPLAPDPATGMKTGGPVPNGR
jgi:hypothetical protein